MCSRTLSFELDLTFNSIKINDINQGILEYLPWYQQNLRYYNVGGQQSRKTQYL